LAGWVRPLTIINLCHPCSHVFISALTLATPGSQTLWFISVLCDVAFESGPKSEFFSICPFQDAGKKQGYTLSEAWSGVNWADLMAAQAAFGADFYVRSTRTILGTMLWTEYIDLS